MEGGGKGGGGLGFENVREDVRAEGVRLVREEDGQAGCFVFMTLEELRFV